MTETKLINKMKCPFCGYSEEIRRDICKEPNGSNLVYYRCKSCSFQWDNDEYEVVTHEVD